MVNRNGYKPSSNGNGDGDQLDLITPSVTGTNWTREQWRLIEWTATPSYERVPLYEKDLAEQIGVSDRTFRNWKKKDGFRDEVRALVRSFIEKDLADIYYALVQEAKKGSFPHIKLVLELLGEYSEHYDVTTGGHPFPVVTYDYNATITQIIPPSERGHPAY